MGTTQHTTGGIRSRAVLTVGAGMAALVVLSACASSGGESSGAAVSVSVGAQPNQDVVALPGQPPESPESRLDAALKRLPAIAESALARTGVPGLSVAVVSGDETVFARGYGVRAAGLADPVTPDTVFQIASMSKPISATAISGAIKESNGTLSWDTPVHELLPNFAFSDPVVTDRATLADTFSHRTGLATGAGDDLEDLGYDRAYILDHLRLQPLSAFRTSYNYSNDGVTIGAESVAASRGQSWDALVDEMVFSPLGMTSSSTRHDGLLSHPDRALLNAKADGKFAPTLERDPDAQAPAGGVSSTVNDIAKWMKLILAGGKLNGVELVDAKALALAMQPQMITTHGDSPTERPAHYGFGFNANPLVGGRMAPNHSGAFVTGAATTFQVVPDLGVGIVVLTNGSPVGLPESVIQDFFDILQFGEPTRDWVEAGGEAFAGYLEPTGDLVGKQRPAAPAAAPDAALLVGRYDNPYFGPLQIEQRGAQLIARLGPDGVTEIPLDPWDGAQFSYRLDNESNPWGSIASATFAPTGARATSVNLNAYDAQQLGTWTRTD